MKQIGIKLADGSFYPVMEEGSAESKVLELTTVHDNQTTVQIDLYRSETGSMADAEYVDTLEIKNLKPHHNGEPNYKLHISLDENDNLTAKVKDPETGTKSETELNLITLPASERNNPVNFSIDQIEETDSSDFNDSQSVNLPYDNTIASDFEDKNVLTGENSADIAEEDNEVIGPSPNDESFAFDSIDSSDDLLKNEETEKVLPDEIEVPADPSDADIEAPEETAETSAAEDFNADDIIVEAEESPVPETDAADGIIEEAVGDDLLSEGTADDDLKLPEMDIPSVEDNTDLQAEVSDESQSVSEDEDISLTAEELANVETSVSGSTELDPAADFDMDSLLIPDASVENTAVEESAAEPALTEETEEPEIEDDAEDALADFDINSLDMPDLSSDSEIPAEETAVTEEPEIGEAPAEESPAEASADNSLADFDINSLDMPDLSSDSEIPAEENAVAEDTIADNEATPDDFAVEESAVEIPSEEDFITDDSVTEEPEVPATEEESPVTEDETAVSEEENTFEIETDVPLSENAVTEDAAADSEVPADDFAVEESPVEESPAEASADNSLADFDINSLEMPDLSEDSEVTAEDNAVTETAADTFNLPDFDDEENTESFENDSSSNITDVALPDFDDMSTEEVPDEAETQSDGAGSEPSDSLASDDDLFNLPDFGDENASDSKPAERDTTFDLPDFDDDNTSASPVGINGIFDDDFGEVDLSDADSDISADDSLDFSDSTDSSDKKDSTFIPSNNMFNDLYDKETLDGGSSYYDENNSDEKKTRIHVRICIICAVICILAVLAMLFIIPSKINVVKKQKKDVTPATEAIEQIEKIAESLPAETEQEPADEEAESEDEEPVADLSPVQIVVEGEDTAAEETEAETEIQQEKVSEEEAEPEEEPVDTSAKEDEIVMADETAPIVPEPPAESEETPEDIRYKIVWGDTLWDISEAYYKNPWRYTSIARYNGIKNPDHIIAGTWILIPAR